MSALKTDFEHVRFEPIMGNGKPVDVWQSKWRSKKKHVLIGDELGEVYWYEPWEQYVFAADESVVFTGAMLREIAAFCESATAERRAGREAHA